MKMYHSKSKASFITKAIVFGVLAVTVFTFGLMLLWNWLMPLIFGLMVITFWQALGLLVLAKLLFGSGHHPHKSWHENEKAKMHKEIFRERMHKAHAVFHEHKPNDSAAE